MLVSNRIYAVDLFKQGKENIRDDMVPYIEWNDEAQKLYDRNRKLLIKI